MKGAQALLQALLHVWSARFPEKFINQARQR